MTNVTDTLTYADASPANGRVVVSWPAFQMDGAAVAGGMQTWEIVNGALSVSLYANVNARPYGMYYTAVYELEEGAIYTEYWIIPDTPKVSLGQVRVAFPVAPSIMISALQLTSAGAAYGQFLGWDGSHWVPMYASSINVSPNTIAMALGSNGTDLNITGSPVALGGTVVLNVPDASATARGVVSIGVQTFAGAKTFAALATFSAGITVTGASSIAGYVPTTRQVIAGYGLSGGGSLAADVTLTAPDNSSNQKIAINLNSTPEGTRHALNFIAGSNVTLTITDQPTLDWVEIIVAATGGGGGGTSLPAGSATGDTLVWQAVPGPGFWTTLPKGAAGLVLTAGASNLSWALPIPNGSSNGDLLRWTGTAWTALARGTTGQVLTAGASAVSWAAPVAQVPNGVNNGDVMIWSSGAWTVLTRGTLGQVLTATSGSTAFQSLPSPTPWNQNMDGGGFQLTNVGKVAVGKTTASYPLDVAGDINCTGAIRVNGVPLAQTPWTSNIDGGAFSLGNVARVGIGLSNPAFPLHLQAAALASAAGSSTIVARMQFLSANNDQLQFYGYRVAVGNSWDTSDWRMQHIVDASPMGWVGFPGTDLVLGTSGSERIHCTTAGQVGINKIPAAAYSLDVSGDCNITGSYRVNGTVLPSPIPQTPWTSDINGNGFRLFSVASVGVNKASAGYAVDVTGDVNVTGVFRMNGVPLAITGVPGGANTQIQYNSGGVFAGSASLTWDGSLHIGGTILATEAGNHFSESLSAGGLFQFVTNTQSFPVKTSGCAIGWNLTNGQGEVNFWNAYTGGNGGFRFHQSLSASSKRDLMILQYGGWLQMPVNYGAGAVQSDPSGTFYVSSDVRMKDVIGDSTDGLAAVLALQPILFRWKQGTGLDPNYTNVGFAAQAVQNILPLAVGQTSDGTLTLNDRAILCALVNAVKELNTLLKGTPA